VGKSLTKRIDAIGRIYQSHGTKEIRDRKRMKRIAISFAVLVMSNVLLDQSAQALNAENDYTGVATGSLLTTTNWSLGHVPTVSEDAVFNSSSLAGIKSLGTGATVGNLTVGSFDVTATTGTYSIRNNTSTATDTILTLGGAGDLGNAVAPSTSDLLFVASGATFQLLGVNGSTGSGVLRVALGQSGNFDAAGTLTIGSVISDGGNNFAITKTGAGTLNLQGANTYGGGLTLSAGTLSIENGGTSSSNSALGTGTFVINGGTITNGGAADVTLATNNAQSWAGDFTFAGGSGTKNLNLGTGAVTLTGNRQINVSGTTSTLTIGGSVGDGGNGFSLTRGGGGLGTLILSGANTYSGGTVISSGKLTANADGALGAGNVSLTAGTVTLTLQNGATQNYIADSKSLSIVTGTGTVFFELFRD
jgi:fibronectin-binding autotransporter adhesin